jgi:hypothetical protein
MPDCGRTFDPSEVAVPLAVESGKAFHPQIEPLNERLKHDVSAIVCDAMAGDSELGLRQAITEACCDAIDRRIKGHNDAVREAQS